MAVDGAQIEPFLEQLQELRIAIDHGDVVFLAGQTLGYGATDLTGAKDENIHGSCPPNSGAAGSMPPVGGQEEDEKGENFQPS